MRSHSQAHLRISHQRDSVDAGTCCQKDGHKEPIVPSRMAQKREMDAGYLNDRIGQWDGSRERSQNRTESFRRNQERPLSGNAKNEESKSNEFRPGRRFYEGKTSSSRIVLGTEMNEVQRRPLNVSRPPVPANIQRGNTRIPRVGSQNRTKTPPPFALDVQEKENNPRQRNLRITIPETPIERESTNKPIQCFIESNECVRKTRAQAKRTPSNIVPPQRQHVERNRQERMSTDTSTTTLQRQLGGQGMREIFGLNY